MDNSSYKQWTVFRDISEIQENTKRVIELIRPGEVHVKLTSNISKKILVDLSVNNICGVVCEGQELTKTNKNQQRKTDN
jgi:hypothetical protein